MFPERGGRNTSKIFISLIKLHDGHKQILCDQSELSVWKQHRKPSHTNLNKTESLGSQNGRSSRGKPQAWLDPRFQIVML